MNATQYRILSSKLIGSICKFKYLLIVFFLGLLMLTGCKIEDDIVSADPEISGQISTWAGTGLAGFDGDGNPLSESNFYWPVDLTVDASGTFYIVDWNNHRIRKVTDEGTLQTVFGTDFVGDGPQDKADLIAPGTPATRIHLNHPTHFLALPNGKFILSAWHNHKLRNYDPSSGLAYVMYGDSPGFDGDGGSAENSLFRQPTQTIVDSNGNFYILDQRNQRVRKIDTEGMVSTVVGTGAAGFSGDGGSPLSAEVNFPGGTNPVPGGALTMDGTGRLYISDTKNHRIRRVDFVLDIIETVAGNGTAGFGGDGAAAKEAMLNNPRDIQIGPDGKLYIADELNHKIRVVDLESGIIDTYAGNGEAKYSGDGQQAKLASLNRPAGIEFDAEGNLYVADTYNHCIRRINK